MPSAVTETTPADGPSYVLARDYLDNNRINLQHYIWTDGFGYLLHPSIPTDNPTLRVADVGTGTGVWLSSLSRQLPPTAQLDGLDISLNAATPSEYLPANITLREWDVTSDVPEDLVGVYDIVHVRLFMFVLKNDQVPHVLANLMRLLKPGGHLQWADADILSFTISKTNPTNSTATSHELLALSQSQDSRLTPTWVSDLPSLFASSNFENVVSDVRDLPPDLGFMMHECNMIIHECIVRTTKNDGVKKGLERLMPLWAKETTEGTMWTFKRSTVVGRKPGSVSDV